VIQFTFSLSRSLAVLRICRIGGTSAFGSPRTDQNTHRFDATWSGWPRWDNRTAICDYNCHDRSDAITLRKEEWMNLSYGLLHCEVELGRILCSALAR
jgi:hypothetical protein